MQIRGRLAYLLIPAAALFATLPLLRYGCSCGHDLDFHLLSWQDAARQFAHGNLHPRWAFTPAFGAGEPRFVFYPPVSWTFGALLTLAASALASAVHVDPAQSFAVVPAAFTGLALTGAGLAMYHLARRFVSASTATLAATLYLANPYTLFTAYERTAFAELLAATLLPLLLAALLPEITRKPTFAVSGNAQLPASGQVRLLPQLSLAIPFALLWLTNVPAAVIGTYLVALAVLLHLLSAVGSLPGRRAAFATAGRATLSALTGFALAAFYIVPVLVERPWAQVAMAILPGLRPDDNTFFHHTADPFHDEVLRTASQLAVLLLGVTIAACLLRLRLRSHPVQGRRLPAILLAFTAMIAFLLTPLSLGVWHHLPELAFLQFPWRLLALLAPVSMLSLALLHPRLSLRPVPLAAISLLLPALLAAAAIHLFRQPCDPEDSPQARFTLFHGHAGDDPTDEYTPATADNDSLKINNPPFRLLPLAGDDDLAPPPEAQPGAAPLALTLTLSSPARLVLNLRDYPTWRVLRNGQIELHRDRRADGLLTLPLPAGTSVLTFAQTTPPAEIAADVLSALAFCLIAFLRRAGT